VQASESWQSYSLCNETSKSSHEEGQQQQPRVFMCSASMTRSRTAKSVTSGSATHDRRSQGSGFGGESWRGRGKSAGEEESQSLDASEVTSR
jgi:hypothetical protein